MNVELKDLASKLKIPLRNYSIKDVSLILEAIGLKCYASQFGRPEVIQKA